ncbi:hypothetical protein VPH35_114396 [Triticum aestivum]
MASNPVVLPSDVLAEVLRRLVPHTLAAARLVCSAWRDTVDARLRGHLLSRSVRGIFINFTRLRFSEFFSRPTTGPAISGGLDFLPCMGVTVTDHCNGLLLCRGLRHECDDALPRDYVVNPATRRWARLPQRPGSNVLGFDQSIFGSCVLAAGEPHNDHDDALLESEWPPELYVIHVFSSATQRWDKRIFIREGEAAGLVRGLLILSLVNNMHSGLWYNLYHYHVVYSRSTLYIHCEHGYLMRMCLSDHTYRVIKLPGVSELPLKGYPEHHLGRSLRGVYCAISHKRSPLLQLWHLNESCSQIEWVLNHDTTLKTFEHEDYAQQMGRQWILQDVNHRKSLPERNGNTHEIYRATVEEKYEWNSDEDNILDIEYDVEEDNFLEEGYEGNYCFLGFHPYKEIVFLISTRRKTRVLAYDCNSSKFQDMGNVCSAYYNPVCGLPFGEMDSAFPYTPCWIGEFPGNELESLFEDKELRRKKSELEEESNLSCMRVYEMRKFHARAKRIKDSATMIRHRRH